MMRRLPVAALTAASLATLTAVTGCSGNKEQLAGPSSPPSAPAALAASAVPSVSRSTDPTATAAPEPTRGVRITTDAQAKSAPSRGGALTLRAVRVAPHEGYDRVVFEFGGDASGVPGYDVGYTRDPRQPGSGAQVPVRGTQALRVLLHGIGYPFDTGVQEPTRPPALPAGLAAVTDVVLGSTYEGDYQAVVGTSGMLPFRVTRLTAPARVVIDVRRS